MVLSLLLLCIGVLFLTGCDVAPPAGLVQSPSIQEIRGLIAAFLTVRTEPMFDWYVAERKKQLLGHMNGDMAKVEERVVRELQHVIKPLLESILGEKAAPKHLGFAKEPAINLQAGQPAHLEPIRKYVQDSASCVVGRRCGQKPWRSQQGIRDRVQAFGFESSRRWCAPQSIASSEPQIPSFWGRA